MGTLVSGSVGIHPLARLLMYVWFGSVGVLTTVFFIAAAAALFLGSPGVRPEALWWAACGPAMLALGYAMLRLGLHIARDENRLLVEFLTRTLQADEEK